jgi:putative ABC transport system substrate-binding protein
MTEVRDQRSAITRRKSGTGEYLFRAICVSFFKLITDLRLLTSGSCALLFALSALLCALSFSASAQQPTRVPRIGYLTASSLSTQSPNIEAFREGLRELGYVERKNVMIEVRQAEGKLDRLPGLAAELVRLKVDVIVTSGSIMTRAAKEATTTIPIVMTQDPDPIGNGFVASLARPGGNITGLSNLNRELSGKRLELLKEVVPKLSLVAVFGTTTFPGNAQALREVELAARAFGVQVQYLDVLNSKDIETAFRKASKGRAEAVLVLGGPCSILSEPESLTLRRRAGSRRCTAFENMLKQGDS